MDGPQNRAGHLIKAGAIGTCLRAHFLLGRHGSAWAKVRQQLCELFPEAQANSIDAVIRLAMAAAAKAREMKRKGPTWIPTHVPDARRVIKDRNRVRRK